MAPKDDTGRAVLAIRSVHGWSRHDLAQLADVSPSTIQRIERGDGAHEASVVARIAKACGMTSAQLTKCGHEVGRRCFQTARLPDR